MPTQEQLRDIFTYRDGCLFWNNTKGKKSKKAGYKEPRGYTILAFSGKKIRLHRLIWVYHNGDIPEDKVIDHINQDNTDNKIENLRLATWSENAINTSKTIGVRKHSTANKWQAYITINGVYHHLGNHDTREQALRARGGAEQELRGVSLRNSTG